VQDILERGVSSDAPLKMRIRGKMLKAAHTAFDALRVTARLALVAAYTGIVAGIANAKSMIHHMFVPEPPPQQVAPGQMVLNGIIEPEEPNQRPPANENPPPTSISEKIYHAAEKVVCEKILGRKSPSSRQRALRTKETSMIF
jgi:hypothetical protein